jgi:hypothetical protein
MRDAHEQAELIPQQITLGDAGPRWALIAGAVGVVGVVTSLVIGLGGDVELEQFYRSFLVNYAFVLSLALGGLFFVLVTHLTRAGWSVALRRIAEVVAWTVLPLSLPALVVVFGMHELYEWTHGDVVAADELLQHKQPWLNTKFFVVRLAFYFLVWNVLAYVFLRRSVTQDRTGDAQITVQLEKFAAPGAIFYAMTVTFAAFDLLMSLTPHWYSTIYGVYYFSGGVVGFFSLVPVLLFTLQRAGKLTRLIHTEHYHDTGKLMFAFVVFWAYIAFSQYLLIWYGNLAEEAVWYEVRQTGPWLGLSLFLLFGHFILPFLWLMSRHPKRHRLVLSLAGVWLLAMHWLDLLYLVMPEIRPQQPIRLLDLTWLVGLGGFFLGVLFLRLGRVNLLPVKDPRLGESLGAEND